MTLCICHLTPCVVVENVVIRDRKKITRVHSLIINYRPRPHARRAWTVHAKISLIMSPATPSTATGVEMLRSKQNPLSAEFRLVTVDRVSRRGVKQCPSVRMSVRLSVCFNYLLNRLTYELKEFCKCTDQCSLGYESQGHWSRARIRVCVRVVYTDWRS